MDKENVNASLKDRKNSVGEQSVDSYLSDPLHLGHLLKFCEGEHNSENVRFIVAVDGFRDMVLTHDCVTWKKSWKELDDELITSDILQNISSTLPDIPNENAASMSMVNISCSTSDKIANDDSQSWSSRVCRISFNRAVRYIWNEFLADSSVNQVCLPSHVAKKLKFRYEYKSLYGPYIFDEACIDPIKTIKRDILPRYLSSIMFKTLQENLSKPYNIMNDIDSIRPNENAHLKHESDEKECRLFELHEILDSGILFVEFLDHLKQTMSYENLLCVRMIAIYEDLIDVPSRYSEAVEHAWKVYNTFIARGSRYEISLNHLDQKDIMLRMANPNLVLFETAKASAYHALRGNFEQFRTTSKYRELASILKQKLVSCEAVVKKQNKYRANNNSSSDPDSNKINDFVYDEEDSNNHCFACFGK